MEREDRVRRQSRSIYSRVRVAGVEFGILYESPRAPHRNSRFLVRVTRRDQQRSESDAVPRRGRPRSR